MRHERELRLAGFRSIAGIDEVGRGSLAGPVVAAAVILPDRHRIKGLRDSKVLARSRREALYEQILDRADAVGVGCIEVEVIDRVNILQATKLAMREALGHLTTAPDHLVIDALSLPRGGPSAAPDHRRGRDQRLDRGGEHRGQGDARPDLRRVRRSLPGYGFARNKGYGTRRHVEALMREGPCEWHRRSFAPLRLILAGEQLSLEMLLDGVVLTEEQIEPEE